jgi:hypothetical protein
MSEQTKQITKTQKDAVRGMIEKIEKELNPRKATLGHYIRLLQLQRELEADEPTGRGQERGLRSVGIAYRPLPSQRRFHDSTARFKGFSGPIGSGKSQALCQEAIRLAYVNQGRTGLIGAPTYAAPVPVGLRRSLRMAS